MSRGTKKNPSKKLRESNKSPIPDDGFARTINSASSSNSNPMKSGTSSKSRQNSITKASNKVFQSSRLNGGADALQSLRRSARLSNQRIAEEHVKKSDDSNSRKSKREEEGETSSKIQGWTNGQELEGSKFLEVDASESVYAGKSKTWDNDIMKAKHALPILEELEKVPDQMRELASEASLSA